MKIVTRFFARFRVLPLLLAFSFIAAACGQAAQPTATMTPIPTSAPPTVTMKPPPTSIPPTATMTLPPTSLPTSTSAVEIDLDIELPEGDAERGRKVALKFTCIGCHVNHPDFIRFDSSDDLPSILERGEVRIADPAYEGMATTNLEYIIESILFPDIYLVSGDWEETMSPFLRDSITEKDIADVIAWMSAFE